MVACKSVNCKKTKDLVDGFCPSHLKMTNVEKLTTLYPCNVCTKEIADKQSAMCCEYCLKWHHITCVNMSKEVYDILFKETIDGISWYCQTCKDKAKEAISKVSSIEQQNKVIKEDVAELKEKVQNIEKTISIQVKESINSSIQEKDDIQPRKLNLIIYGVPEHDPNDENKSNWDNDAKIAEDTKTISSIITNELGVGLSPRNTIYDAKRIGLKKADKKPRAVRITFDSIETKRDVLSGAKKLRLSSHPLAKNMYIAPDLTKNQREQQNSLRDEMWKRRERGENVIIKKGSIVQTTQNVRKTRPVKSN